MADSPDRLNRVGVALIALGSAITLGGVTYLVILFVGWLRGRRLPRPLPEAVVAYRGAMEEALQVRQRKTHLEQVHVAVRDYLGGATLPDSALAELWDGHPLHERIVNALRMLQEAVAANRLSGFEEQEVMLLIEKLIDAQIKAEIGVITPSLWARIRTLPARWPKCIRVKILFKRRSK